MTMNTERLDLLLAAIEDVYDDYPKLKSHLALARECVRQIDVRMIDMSYDIRQLRADCDRLRKELDECNGVIR